MSAYTGWQFEVEWTSGVWTDETDSVDGVIAITRGRNAEGSDINPGTLAVTLDNATGRLTAGSPLSPVDVDLGKRCHARETVGGITYDRFVGYLTDIDPNAWTDDGDRAVRLTFTDLLDRLARGRPFGSALAAHIINAGAANLIGYWSLDDADGTELKAAAGTLGNIPLLAFVNDGPVSWAARVLSWLDYRRTAGPAAEDSSFATFAPTFDVTGFPASFIEGRKTIDLTLSGQTLTMCIWHKTSADYNPASVNTWTLFDLYDVTGATSVRFLLSEAAGTPLEASLISNAAGTSVAGPSTTSSRSSTENWHLTTLQVTLPSGQVSMWRDLSFGSTSTMTGTPPTSMQFTGLKVGSRMQGALAHLQLYLGDANSFTYAMHREQFRQGSHGLIGQYPGERIATLAAYAGATLLDLDTGTTRMKAPALAGKTPGGAAGDAATTELGDLFVRGDGYLSFRARTYRYTAAPKVTIEKAWIDDGLRPRVDGPRYNSADVSIVGGPTAHAEDAGSIDAQGVLAAPEAIIEAELDSAADARAAFLVYQYAVRRVRVPALPITLMHQAAAVKHAVLSLDVADRIDLDGMPNDYPVGADRLHIEGYTERIGESLRDIVFVTSPVLGRPAGNPERWFTLDDATFGKLDAGNKLTH